VAFLVGGQDARRLFRLDAAPLDDRAIIARRPGAKRPERRQEVVAIFGRKPPCWIDR